MDELCDYLTDEDLLHYQRGKWYWMSDGFPANNVNLRSAAQDSFAIIDITDQGHAKVIGEEDRFGAMTMLYEDAIYIHQGAQYHVDDLDLIERKAYVRKVNVNYYTDSDLAVQLDVLAMDKHAVFDNAHIEKGYGDVSVRALPTIFKKFVLKPMKISDGERYIFRSWKCTPMLHGLVLIRSIWINSARMCFKGLWSV
ncbi:ATP-dependent RNA helicase [Sporolactobacillus inulinus]|uniref:ATP-dependent RNA helicase n=1 Tax=Sporolactobacillus inulinus TaxID=2078 RepID=A0A4Y1ZA66_9BACL|nr:ATP-dependent RNA helicase [Sporolactobacillus inulinus]